MDRLQKLVFSFYREDLLIQQKLQFKVNTILDYGATIDINSQKHPNSQ